MPVPRDRVPHGVTRARKATGVAVCGGADLLLEQVELRISSAQSPPDEFSERRKTEGVRVGSSSSSSGCTAAGRGMIAGWRGGPGAHQGSVRVVEAAAAGSAKVVATLGLRAASVSGGVGDQVNVANISENIDQYLVICKKQRK
jgi:hypothetical protein